MLLLFDNDMLHIATTAKKTKADVLSSGLAMGEPRPRAPADRAGAALLHEAEAEAEA